MTLAWQNGIPFSAHFGDVYFSADSGLEETRHVFLKNNRLAERFAALSAGECFSIGETGFGTGLNFLAVWQLFEQATPPGTSLDFFSIEKFPLEDDELRAALALWPELDCFTAELLARWRRRVPGWNRWTLAGGRIRLTLAIDDVAEVLAQLPAAVMDAWFMDGFSPARNPEMWSEEVLAGVARTSRPLATLATYTSAGWVRRGLQQTGFAVERTAGFGSKREMLRGQMRASSGAMESMRRTPVSAMIIGGGVAGCAVAHALAQRGIAVTLFERAPRLASAASGNPCGILHARFGVGDNPLHLFVQAAYGHALALLDEVLPVDGEVRAECGLLQLGFSPGEHKRIARIAGHQWPAHLLRPVDAVQATALTGMEMAYGGLWFPGGGWIVPSAFCTQLANHAHISVRTGHTAEKLTPTTTGWRITGACSRGETWVAEAEILVVCCAHAALSLEQFAHFPLTPVRGQVSLLPATEASLSLQAVVCGDGYCSPARDGMHVAGATHAFGDASLGVRACDHVDNLSRLSLQAPSLRAALGEIDVEQLDGRAAMRCSAPLAMPLVGEVQAGLYCSLAHGTRGLISAGLAGEIIAALSCGQLPPLPTHILSALAPGLRIKRTG